MKTIVRLFSAVLCMTFLAASCNYYKSKDSQTEQSDGITNPHLDSLENREKEMPVK